MHQIEEWYKYQQELALQKCQDLQSDALEEIKAKIRRKQTLQEKD